MGFFTWTYADVPLSINKDGNYRKNCVLQYGDYGALVCPDNVVYEETCYDGYGIFAGRDVYELAADWNRPFIRDIVENNKIDLTYQPREMRDIMLAFADNDEEMLRDTVLKATVPYLKSDWKRSIGIAICCENNGKAPYPIKIVKTRRPLPYDRYGPSISTQ